MVSVGRGIDEATSTRLLSLAEQLRHALAELPELDITPAYDSLLVSFRPGALGETELRRVVSAASLAGISLEGRSRTFVIPVAYGGEMGPDLSFLAGVSGLTPEEVIALHASISYRIYCLGFTPGFPYLGGLAPALHVPRLASPRPRVAAGSVGIGGAQTGVYPTETPGGWRIIGRTPLVLFDPSGLPPTAYLPGDYFRFEPISAAEFERLLLRRLNPEQFTDGRGQ